MAPKSDHCLVKDNAEKLPEQVSASNIERKLDPTCNEVFDSRTKTEYEVIRESPSKTSSDAAVPFKSILRNQDSESTSHTVTNYQNVTANVSDSETKTLNNIVKQQQVDSRTELEHETDSVIKNRPVNTAEESSETTQIQSSLEVSRGHPVASTRVQSTSDQVRSDQSDTLVKLDTSSQNIAEKGKVTITPKLSKGSAADMTASELETKSLVPSAPVLIDLWETQDNTGTGAMMEEGRVCSVIYPKLESFLQGEYVRIGEWREWTGWEGRGGQGRAGQARAGQDKIRQGKAGQDRTGQSKAEQDRAGQGRAGQNRTGQSRAEQGRAGQGRVGQSKGRAEQGRRGEEGVGE